MRPTFVRTAILATAFNIANFIWSSPAQAEDLNAIFTKVNQLIEAKNYTKAMTELSWARKEIEKLHQGRIGELLPASIGSLLGQEVQYQSALGFTNIERVYKGGEQEVKLTITGGGGDGLGGLAGLAKMGMMFGAQPGVDQFRVDGVTASLNTTGSYPEVTIFLDGGAIVNLTAQNGVDAAALKKYAEGFKFTDLDAYLGGGK